MCGISPAVSLPTIAVRDTMSLQDQLIADAEAYCAQAGISKARLATIVAKDGKFFVRLGRGGSCTLAMYERFQAFFSENGMTKSSVMAPGNTP